jgi:succinate dehydrogenase / fumarate reductase iron-sulfur subunit
MRLILEIQRFNSKTDKEPAYVRYEVEVQPTERILDALMQIKSFQDPTLAFRKSCAHGVCGSDAMRINGKERLACKTLVQDVAEKDGDIVKIAPLSGFPIERDLIVNQSAFFEKYLSVKPFLINEEPVKEKERLQSPIERQAFDDATSCILCCACFSACPIMKSNPDFLGPAIVAQASRFLDDTRDKGFEQRLPQLDSPNGAWPCANHFECTRVCPREIKITKRINETKRKIQEYRESRGEPVHDGS